MYGKPTNAVTAQGTAATSMYKSIANPRLGISVANPDRFRSLTVSLTLTGREGQQYGEHRVTLPPRGHTAFNLFQVFRGLSDGFTGTVTISPTEPRYCVAWTMSADVDTGLFYTLPSGNYRWPPSQKERLQLVFSKVKDAAVQVVPELSNIKMEIGEEKQINAYALPDARTIRINLATAEMMADSDSELAFVMGHEMGHIIQARTGQYVFSTNPELDADALGTWLVFIAGYDPYAAAGVFGKLQMGSGTPGLLGEIFRELGVDPHKSFAGRIDNVLATLNDVCSMNEMVAACAGYKSGIHPHFPSILPLAHGERRSAKRAPSPFPPGDRVLR